MLEIHIRHDSVRLQAQDPKNKENFDEYLRPVRLFGHPDEKTKPIRRSRSKAAGSTASTFATKGYLRTDRNGEHATVHID